MEDTTRNNDLGQYQTKPYPVADLVEEQFIHKRIEIPFILSNGNSNLKVRVHPRRKGKIVSYVHYVNPMRVVSLPSNILLESSGSSPSTVHLVK